MNRSFWIFVTGQAVTVLGNAFGTLALGWLVYELTGSMVALGTLVMVGRLPEVIFRFLSGPLLDRFNRLRLMAGIELAQALVFAVPVALAATGHLAIWHLYLLSVLAGLLSAPYMPASAAVVPALVAPQSLVRANSVSQTVVQIASMAGPALAGLVIAAVGGVYALALDAVSFLLSALSLLLLPRAAGQVARGAGPQRGYLAQLVEGMAFFRRAPVLLYFMVGAAVANMGISALQGMMIPYVTDHLGAEASQIGTLTSAMYGGMLLISFLLTWVGDLQSRSLVMLASLLAAGLGMIGLGLVGRGMLLPALLLVGLIGVCMGAFTVFNSVVYQRMVPGELMGRVMSVRGTIASIAMPAGALAGSVLAEAAGLGAMMAALGLLPLVVALAAPLIRGIGGIDGEIRPVEAAAKPA
ncbi:MAG: MFS transporter [Bacillota bacterium]